MFKQPYLSELLFEFASDHINAYIYPLPIHEYIQNKFLTCSCEVADPILSQNIDQKYVVPNAKQKLKECKQAPEDVLRSMASLGPG